MEIFIASNVKMQDEKNLNCAYPKNVVFAEMCNYCSTKTVSQNVNSSPDKKVALKQKLGHGWLFSKRG